MRRVTRRPTRPRPRRSPRRSSSCGPAGRLCAARRASSSAGADAGLQADDGLAALAGGEAHVRPAAKDRLDPFDRGPGLVGERLDTPPLNSPDRPSLRRCQMAIVLAVGGLGTRHGLGEVDERDVRNARTGTMRLSKAQAAPNSKFTHGCVTESGVQRMTSIRHCSIRCRTISNHSARRPRSLRRHRSCTRPYPARRSASGPISAIDFRPLRPSVRSNSATMFATASRAPFLPSSARP